MTDIGTIQTAASARASRHPSRGRPARGRGPRPRPARGPCLSCTEQLQAFEESHIDHLCALDGCTSHTSARATAHARPTSRMFRDRLPDECKLWPPPSAQSDEAWPDRWNVGVLDGGELPMPRRLHRFGENWP
jgi:hypothetical protein